MRHGIERGASSQCFHCAFDGNSYACLFYLTLGSRNREKGTGYFAPCDGGGLWIQLQLDGGASLSPTRGLDGSCGSRESSLSPFFRPRAKEARARESRLVPRHRVVQRSEQGFPEDMQ